MLYVYTYRIYLDIYIIYLYIYIVYIYTYSKNSIFSINQNILYRNRNPNRNNRIKIRLTEFQTENPNFKILDSKLTKKIGYFGYTRILPTPNQNKNAFS